MGYLKRICKYIVSGSVVMAMMLGLSGCAAGRQTDSDNKRYIAVICKGSQHEFWKTVEQGALDAGKELGVEVTFEAPQDESQIDEQIRMVEQAIENHADAIVLAPLDTEKLNDVIDRAVEKGIPVITLDSDVSTETRTATIGTSNESAGAIAARNAVELMNGEGQIAIISHVEGSQTATERNNGFINEIASDNASKIEIVALEYCGGDADAAKELALKFIDDNPELSCIYGTNEGCAMGAAAAVEELGLKDEIIVIGFDSSDEEIAYLEAGVIDGMVVQNPYNMGYLGVRNIYKVLEGQVIEQKINTGATYISLDNLYDEDTQWLLYPLGRNAE